MPKQLNSKPSYGVNVLAIAAIMLGTITQLACERQVSTSAPPPPSAVDVPGVAARIGLLEGTVSMQPAGIDDWTPAELNRTLTSGDAVWTSGNGRAEVGSGSTAMRLDANTNFRLLQLNDNLTQVSITDGAFNVRLRRLDEGEAFEIDTPDAVVTLLRPGNYRVDVDPNTNVTSVTVRAGEAAVDTGRESFAVKQDQRAMLGFRVLSGYQISSALMRDPFDAFCENRDQRQDRAEAARYVSPEVTGYSDLDGYGAWSVDVAWGPMWCPGGMPVGWAPYRYGHWIWVEPWGWVWVDDAPWGYAPFHYGRWFYSTNWCWLPGPMVPRPFYAGGLVAFVGGGGPGFQYHVWLGAGTGVGWFPLGPGEVYFPPYRYSRRYLVNINVTNTVIRDPRIYDIRAPGQHYIHQQMGRAVTVVPRDGFVRGQPVSRNMVAMQDSTLRDLHVHGMAPPLAPTRESVGPPAGGAPRPPSSVNRTVLTQHEPPRVVPFEQRRQQLESSPGRPIEGRAADNLRRAAPAPNVRQLPERPQTGPAPAARPQAPVQPAPQPIPAPQTVPRQTSPPAQERRPQPTQTQRPPERTPRQVEPSSQRRADERQVQQRSHDIQRERQREDSARHQGQQKPQPQKK
jgi:hypothetical protein